MLNLIRAAASILLRSTLLLVLPLVAFADNPVQIENAKTGDTSWELTNPATSREIEGYASLTSVNRRDTIDFFVSTSAGYTGSYTIDFYRMGWYDGMGARKMPNSSVERNGFNQTTPTANSEGLIECNWIQPYTLTVPSDWVSGVYIAKLTRLSTPAKESYIIFVVRDDDRASDYLFQSSVTTFQAYNNWPGIAAGGKSLYPHNSVGNPAVKVSFNRPYGIEPTGDSNHPGPSKGLGAGEFFTVHNAPLTSIVYSAAWEYNMVRFLEDEGYDVSYSTDIDTHTNGDRLLSHKGFLSVGHDEYWSFEMRDKVEAARNAGVSLGFFGANIAYWQIRLEPSVVDSSKLNRTMVCYKSTADPFSDLTRLTVRWRDSPLNRPEDAFIGSMTDDGILNGDDPIVVTNASSWVFSGTGLQNNDTLPGLLGYEVDHRFGHEPANTVTLAHSPAGSSSDVTIYTASGAIVFATGSMQWNWGLDDYNAPTLRPSRLSAVAQQTTRNVLNQMRASAVFVGEDNSTQGSWKGVYGADGYRIVGDVTNYPSYAQVSIDSANGPASWAASTSDIRALQKAAKNSTDRIASTLYSETNFTIDINLTDGREHRVAAYVLDWDGNNIRAQSVEVTNVATNAVLHTHTVDDFSSGRYLVWRLRGHVRIKFTHMGITGSNAVISGLFFDAPPSSAAFVNKDTTTQGSWKGVYGADGYNVIADTVNYPSYAQVSVSGNTPFTWTSSTSDVRALQKAASGSSDRLAAIWYSETSLTIDINLTDGQEHRLAAYVIDWDGNNIRSERIDVLDAVTNAVLDTRDVEDFSSGHYLVWRLRGHVKIKVAHTGIPGSNAVISGLFFDVPPVSAVFAGRDITTQGSWKGLYGADGYNIIADTVSSPLYAQVSVSGQTPFTWTSSTSDLRALQKAASGSTDRIAAIWYSETSFTIDINLTDGAQHQVGFYCLDWDGNDVRSQKLEVLDAATNTVIDTRDVDDFSSGHYLVWKLRGHVKLKLTHKGVAGSNAVISGLFFN